MESQTSSISQVSPTLEDTYQSVKLLENKINETRKYLTDLTEKYDEHMCILTKLCPHECYTAYDDGDYHRPGYYYVCKLCKKTVMFKPTGKQIDYKY